MKNIYIYENITKNCKCKSCTSWIINSGVLILTTRIEWCYFFAFLNFHLYRNSLQEKLVIENITIRRNFPKKVKINKISFAIVPIYKYILVAKECINYQIIALNSHFCSVSRDTILLFGGYKLYTYTNTL